MANGNISATTEKGSSAKVVIGTSAIPLDNYLVVEPVHGRESEAVDESKGTAPKAMKQMSLNGAPRAKQWLLSFPNYLMAIPLLKGTALSLYP